MCETTPKQKSAICAYGDHNHARISSALSATVFWLLETGDDSCPSERNGYTDHSSSAHPPQHHLSAWYTTEHECGIDAVGLGVNQARRHFVCFHTRELNWYQDAIYILFALQAAPRLNLKVLYAHKAHDCIELMYQLPSTTPQ